MNLEPFGMRRIARLHEHYVWLYLRDEVARTEDTLAVIQGEPVANLHEPEDEKTPWAKVWRIDVHRDGRQAGAVFADFIENGDF